MLYNVREKKVIDRIAYKGFDVDQCIPAFCGHRFIVRSVGHESIMLWNKETKEIEEIFSFSGGVAYSPFESENGNYLLHVGSPVVVWDRANQKELHTVENYGQKIKSGALSASNNLCALGPYNNQAVAVFDLETKTIKTQCGKGALDCFFLDFCNNDKFIIVGSDHKAAIWNVETGECEGVIPFALRLHCMKYNHRNALLVGLNNCGSVQIWNTDQKQMIYSFKLDGMKNVFTIDLDPTGMLLAVYGKDCRLYFVDSELPKKWLQVQLATLAQASFIARAYAAYQQDNYFKIQLGSDDVVSYMKFPAFVRAYLHFCLNIKLPTYQEVVSYRNANEVLSKICNK
jgi:WD40 repeat protein